MKLLSKSKLMAFRQCPKRLWLSEHPPELDPEADAARTRVQVGVQVGELARRLYDPRGRGTILDPQAAGYDSVIAQTQALLQGRHPIFEGGFQAAGALVFADVRLSVTGLPSSRRDAESAAVGLRKRPTVSPRHENARTCLKTSRTAAGARCG